MSQEIKDVQGMYERFKERQDSCIHATGKMCDYYQDLIKWCLENGAEETKIPLT